MAYTKEELEAMNRQASSSSLSKWTVGATKNKTSTTSNAASLYGNILLYPEMSSIAKNIVNKTAGSVNVPAYKQPYETRNALDTVKKDVAQTITDKIVTDAQGYAGKELSDYVAQFNGVSNNGSDSSVEEATTSSKEVATPTYEKETMITENYGDSTEVSAPTFQVSDAYLQAMEYTNSLLSQMNSGRTSYTDQIEELLKEYKNRDVFSYDAATDPMFQQMLAGYMNSGKIAMQDTIGQAAALTGGYGNTYGTAAGNAVYNQYLSEAYGNLPEYYNLALEAYNMQGDQMLNELAMLQDSDNREYDRMMNAYTANLGAANALYNQEYDQYLKQLSQSNYEKEFAYQKSQDALAQQNYENEFAYQQYLDELSQSNYEKEFAYQQSQDALNQNNYENEVAYQKYLDELNYNAQDASESSVALSNTDIERIKEVYAKNGGGDAGKEAVNSYLDVIGKNDGGEEYYNGIDAILESVSVPIEYQNWTIKNDTKNGGFLWFGKGEDHNDTYTNGSTTLTYDELKDIIEASDMSYEEKEELLNNLKSQSKR